MLYLIRIGFVRSAITVQHDVQAASPASRSESARSPSDLLSGTSGERRPFFPSSAVSPSGPPDPSSVELQGDHSLVARSDDPELATQVNLGGVQNTLLAQFEYQRLEFEIPSEVVRDSLTPARCSKCPYPTP